jgi:hypothetical protein
VQCIYGRYYEAEAFEVGKEVVEIFEKNFL